MYSFVENEKKEKKIVRKEKKSLFKSLSAHSEHPGMVLR